MQGIYFLFFWTNEVMQSGIWNLHFPLFFYATYNSMPLGKGTHSLYILVLFVAQYCFFIHSTIVKGSIWQVYLVRLLVA